MNDTPRIALLGYGRMGKELHRMIGERQWPEPIIIDPTEALAFSTIVDAPLDSVDVCLEFTEPSKAAQVVLEILERGLPVISGTTGWESRQNEIRDAVQSLGGAFLHAGNFSIGVHVFARIVRYAAELLGRFPQYDLALHELHHRGKKDVPSGTAQMLARHILDMHTGKSAVSLLSQDGPLMEQTLYISSTRVGNVFGEHQVIADSEVDTIELRHSAKGRRGFAEGALTAAQWIIGKHGYFSLEDMFDDITTA
ncbi:MAG: 4-hydroxy-tetrahydrodipicolinate reductase [Bacteroidetes bacterium]|nr:4-hydroxy-tetrahydrodipicolinate reductase [Bacteroidota bacterium]